MRVRFGLVRHRMYSMGHHGVVTNDAMRELL
ncbi:hypothetical protein EV644_119142, partial [Kribbella orskensis]